MDAHLVVRSSLPLRAMPRRRGIQLHVSGRRRQHPGIQRLEARLCAYGGSCIYERTDEGSDCEGSGLLHESRTVD